MITVISKKLEFIPNKLFNAKWKELVHKAQDEFKIHFDLENDEPVGDVRRLSFPTDSEFNDKQIYYVQLMSAGGDWENPVLYFRIQVKDGWRKEHMFIYIPPKGKGNNSIIKSEEQEGYVASHNGGKEYPKNSEKEAWADIKSYLKNWSDRDMDQQ